MQVEKGDTVRLHFTGSLKGQEPFASTEDKEPVEFTAGVGEMVPGIDEALIGMEKGEEKDLDLPPEKGFGERNEELVVQAKKALFEGKEVSVGQRINVQTEAGQTIPAQVTDIGEAKVTLDMNHPFAGKETTFHIKLVDLEK